MQRFDRLIGLMLWLRGGGRFTAAELAERFEVSARTIYRDLDLLSALGVPVYAERGRSGGIRLMRGYFLPPVMFTTGEATSLVSGLALLRRLRAVPFAAELDTARRKLLAAVPDDLRATLADAERVIGFEAPPADIFHPEPEERAIDIAPRRAPADEGAVVTAFAEALFSRQRVHLRYHTPWRPDAGEVEATPLGLFWDRQRWYLAARIGAAARPRLFRADRVQRISPGGPASQIPDFDVRSLLERAWLRDAMQRWAEDSPVRVRITTRQRERLAGDWYYRHARYDDLPDGGAIMTWGEVDRDTLFELVRWLGPGAELLEPAEWREAFREELAGWLEQPSPPAPLPTAGRGVTESSASVADP